MVKVNVSSFLKINSCLLFFIQPIVNTSCQQHAAPETKPNIILMNIDDMGWRDVGFMGSEFYETPILDALAAQGMIFITPENTRQITANQYTYANALQEAGYITCHAGKWHVSSDPLNHGLHHRTTARDHPK